MQLCDWDFSYVSPPWTSVTLKMVVFWVVTPYSLVDGATTQKTAIFIPAALRTSNPIKYNPSHFP
jgi:hypothetical protein